jgi:hypothetical protein
VHGQRGDDDFINSGTIVRISGPAGLKHPILRMMAV